MSEQVNRLLYFKSYVSVLFQVMYEDCKEIVDTCTDNNVWLAVCHVLRYCPQARKIKQIIESGAIGDVMNIQLLEPVSIFLLICLNPKYNVEFIFTESFFVLIFL